MKKNVQVIDGAINCVYDIFSISEEDFKIIFPDDTNIAFIDEIYERSDPGLLDKIFECMWKNRIKKMEVLGIHGTLFYELDNKKIFYPTRKDEDAVNPDGSLLR